MYGFGLVAGTKISVGVASLIGFLYFVEYQLFVVCLVVNLCRFCACSMHLLCRFYVHFVPVLCTFYVGAMHANTGFGLHSLLPSTGEAAGNAAKFG